MAYLQGDVLMRRLIVFIALVLAGCHTLTDAMQPLVGQNIRVLFGRIGYPTSQQVIAGDTVYAWSLQSADNQTPGCLLQVGVDSSGAIRNFSWQGSAIGCDQLRRRLDE